MKQITLWLLLLALAGCGGDLSPTRVPPTAPPAAARPSATPPRPTAAPTPTSGFPTATAAQANPTLAPAPPPLLLADRDPGLPRAGFGPASPGAHWLVTRDANDFALVALNGRASLVSTGAATATAGLPLDWTADGSLLLFRAAGDPASLWALEPTTGITLSIVAELTAPLRDAAWLTSVIIYATDGADGASLTLHAYRGEAGGRIMARLPGLRLLDGGIATNPNRREAALLVSGAISPTTELYRLDDAGNLARIDGRDSLDPGARAVWSPRGGLAYNLGGGLHIFDPATGGLQDTGLAADPLAWQGAAVLARRREDGALLRWSQAGIQPFDTGSGPLVVDDAQAIGPTEVALLIGGQIWQVGLP
ncbi:MAG TPA: hypothetical protein VD886_13440 [Herpetosiphonaceae bacterium]|nr:hypothetical protein [Herpetosiphonaceae bacterium]